MITDHRLRLCVTIIVPGELRLRSVELLVPGRKTSLPAGGCSYKKCVRLTLMKLTPVGFQMWFLRKLKGSCEVRERIGIACVGKIPIDMFEWEELLCDLSVLCGFFFPNRISQSVKKKVLGMGWKRPIWLWFQDLG